MEKRIVPNARDEIKKLQEALKTKSEEAGSADNTIAKGTRNSWQESEANPSPDEQTADNFAAQANRKNPKR
ncbi:MAG TPA: hypothetical protein VIE89_10005 [Candidatus Binatia bacterium]|jgi:hypothetical protein